MRESYQFDEYLRNDVHDWMSVPHSMHGIRISGRRRQHGCIPVGTELAGLDYLTFHCIYLEPLLAFEIDGEMPSLVNTSWTPSELMATYQSGDIQLVLKATMPDPDSLLVVAELYNASAEAKSMNLTVFGEEDRRIDPEDSIDIDMKGSGYGKNFLEAAHRRISDQVIIAECIGDIGESHRGGLTNYDKFRVCRWHHARMTGTIALTLPPEGESADTPGQWRQTWNFTLEPDSRKSLTFRGAMKYQARQRLEESAIKELTGNAQNLGRAVYEDVVNGNRQYWQDLLEKISPPAQNLDDIYKQMYYRAWVCIWQLVTPGFDTGRMDGLTFEEACLLVTKADHRATMPAEWETALGALLINQIDPQLAAKITDSILASVEPDGYVPETLVFTKENMLAYMTSYLMWEIYRKTGDKGWMKRHYETQKRSIWAHYRNANFKRRGKPTVRNMIYVHIGFIYLLKIAEEIRLPQREIDCMRWMVDETEQIVQNFWDGERNHFSDSFNDRHTDEGGMGFCKESSVQCMAALFAGATEDQIPYMLKDLKETYLVGEYGIRETGNHGGADPQGASMDQTDLSKMNTYKHSNFVYFIPGLEKVDKDLCREVCLRTIKGITQNGDFHEQMRCNMDKKAFGPMSVFGAYGYIKSMQTLTKIGVEVVRDSGILKSPLKKHE